VEIVGGSRNYIYGAEYETGGSDHTLAQLHDQEVPCVVCHTPNTNIIMVPAKSTCHSGWTLEYSGFLMANYRDYQRTNYVCMDGEAVALDDSHGSQNGALFYFTQVVCGHSLPCGPYTDGYELTCAVCSLPPVMRTSDP